MHWNLQYVVLVQLVIDIKRMSCIFVQKYL